MIEYRDPIIIEPQQRPAHRAIIWCHGLGADGSDFVPIIPKFNIENTRFIFPHAPFRKVTVNDNILMPAWYDIKSFDKHNEDSQGIYQSQQYINSLIEQQVNQGIDYKNIFLVGFSQGAALSLYTGINHTPTLGGVIALSGYLPLLTSLKIKELNTDLPILICHGISDDIVKVEFGSATHKFLEFANFKNLQFKSYPIAHELSDPEIIDCYSWVKKLLDA